MSVYDRNMFRGSRPTEVLMKKAGEKVMSDAMGGIAAAKDPVELMNAMRGDERTMKAVSYTHLTLPTTMLV